MEIPNVGDQGHAPVTRRALLLILVKGGLSLGVAAFASVFVIGLLAPGGDSDNVIDVGGIAPGSARLEGWDGNPLCVVNRTVEQLRGLDALAGYVEAPGEAGNATLDNPWRSLRPAFGIYLARTKRTGVLVQYTRDRPAGLSDGVPWSGGFVDPGSGAVFDVAGRRYRNTSGGPLRVPPHRFVAPGVVRLGQW